VEGLCRDGETNCVPDKGKCLILFIYYVQDKLFTAIGRHSVASLEPQ
jgi:hypothetical protein